MSSISHPDSNRQAAHHIHIQRCNLANTQPVREYVMTWARVPTVRFQRRLVLMYWLWWQQGGAE